MIDALINRVWSNPRLPQALDVLERLWIARSAGVDLSERSISIERSSASRYVEAAAILACSSQTSQRLAAYRLATYVHELFAGSIDGLDAAVRAVLVRLGNFPSVLTNGPIGNALTSTPWVVAEEEFVRRRRNEVSVASSLLSLTDFQKSLWDSLSSGSSIAISAPTSTGKSFILQAFISNAYASRADFCACYVVPTRALISQVQADLKVALADAAVSDVEVITVPPEADEQLPARVVFVFTQERLQILLNNDLDRVVDFLVIDEAHSVQDGDRGILLQGVIDELVVRRPQTQLLFASPTVSNLEIFGRMTGRSDIQSCSTDEATVSQNFIEVEVTGVKQGDVKLFARDGTHRNEVGTARLGHTLASKIDCLVHLSHRFGSGKQSIVYADGQADAEKIALQISSLRALNGHHQPDSEALQNLSNLAKEAVHPKYALAATVMNGVGFHYGNIPTALRNAVEQAFSAGELQYLVCTSTLLAGVNMPAQNIFMHTPQRKRSTPLQSIDFWNLSGRAGRLRKEFQGNIYLLNYEEWKEQPLSGPRLSPIVPAMQQAIDLRSSDLNAVIGNDVKDAIGQRGELETAFVRLLTDYKSGRIAATLDRSYASPNPASRQQLESSLSVADKLITLPPTLLRLSPTISAHRQQDLFNYLASAMASNSREVARRFLPAHPREGTAFDSYVRVLELVHRTILPKTNSQKQNRFFAVMLLKWMQGTPIPELIDDRARYQEASINTHIRATLDLVEKELRFNYVGAFGCYSAILAHVFSSVGFDDLAASIPSLALYLEVGASDRTMISFVALGISRMTAKRLNSLCPNKSLGVIDARNWLMNQDLNFFGFSAHIRRELELVLGITSST
ncbi:MULTISPECIES: DEAD/DEAH box helicase [Bradyrhizobium]|uniref:DEAD/DEAH box helicase n=1 Tax=Bradyrhizobium TaxID=374 RepID=UPI0004BA6837|nr:MULTISPECIES: DEAD/DEAH box helicase [Bradyrhizobium]MCS3444983.1 superfamily II DNA/RNA helicase [Bradyrhizobium elkanii]MCS3563889.1 superfamily II DNA/RNA helicase [Bradyrhizobium elkanii]MCW2146279.1 superfamily II DNA/RNA helicase [Bradyrhizobium elkanii]MCW2354648.1 superfamily II DNA/RNA helicase [Bradyrhizobium elkanii]MCW2379106.1 superfamily II DNA/RNA helicase [Bradyrhizobium elkanii]